MSERPPLPPEFRAWFDPDAVKSTREMADEMAEARIDAAVRSMFRKPPKPSAVTNNVAPDKSAKAPIPSRMTIYPLQPRQLREFEFLTEWRFRLRSLGAGR
jgi:hypothetical protein